MPSRWSRHQRWSGVGGIVPDPANTQPKDTDPPSHDLGEPVEFAGVGDVRMVRTFRVGDGGGLSPVNSANAWPDGWNAATCLRNPEHRPPEAQCRCGFYAYSDAAYVREQPPARQVLAMVAT